MNYHDQIRRLQGMNSGAVSRTTAAEIAAEADAEIAELKRQLEEMTTSRDIRESRVVFLHRRCSELEAERDNFEKGMNTQCTIRYMETERAEKAEAENARLKDKIAEFIDGEGGEDIVHPSLGG